MGKSARAAAAVAAAAAPSPPPPQPPQPPPSQAEPAPEAEAEAEAEVNPRTGSPFSRRFKKLLERRKKLALWAQREKVRDALAKHAAVVVGAAPGSGKSTQIPQFVIEAGYPRTGKQIACTQPRRLVATAVARRVAQEMDVSLGEEVGYSVLYLTDGVLLREILSDRFLEKYEVIILDEVHLRTLATDILLGYLKNLLSSNARPDLKLVVMSSQYEATKFKEYLKSGRIVQPSPTLHPIEIMHEQQPVEDYIKKAIEIVERVLTTEPNGDILVFLTGSEEIDSFCWNLKKVVADLGDKIGAVNVLRFTLRCLLINKRRKGGPIGRKVVVSTDIGESSLAIEGIVYVIDCGYTKQKVYNAQLNVESLLILPISRANAQRRSALARRTASGKCFRLYSKQRFLSAQAEVSPEIFRANLASIVLLMKKIGIEDFANLDLMDPPHAEMVERAFETLKCLGALDGEGTLTDLGELISHFPLDPQMSRMIVTSPMFRCSNEILSIAAMLS
ncbi:putative pre-mRNA-splicing factor ATP-dependent RNA helicase, partial [Ananas comosus]